MRWIEIIMARYWDNRWYVTFISFWIRENQQLTIFIARPISAVGYLIVSLFHGDTLAVVAGEIALRIAAREFQIGIVWLTARTGELVTCHAPLMFAKSIGHLGGLGLCPHIVTGLSVCDDPLHAGAVVADVGGMISYQEDISWRACQLSELILVA